jgi:hypothetical protein
MLRQLFLLFAIFSARCEALRVATRPGLTSVTTTHPCRACVLVARPSLASSLTSRKIPLVSLRASSSDEEEDRSSESYSKAYFCLGVASVLSWTLVSFIVLQSHPDPRFADCTLRHNILTTAQALIFPLPVLGATFVTLQSASKVGWNRLQSATYRRLNLGLAVASLWLAASSAFPAVFAFGYDLIPLGIKGLSTAIHLASASLALTVWIKTVESENNIGLLVSRVARGFVGSIWKLAPTKPSDDPDDADGLVSSLYALATVGFFWFSVSPIVSSYPLATVPSILGKRLTRPAAAFTWLAAVMSYCLKDAADRGAPQQDLLTCDFCCRRHHHHHLVDQLQHAYVAVTQKKNQQRWAAL